MATIEIDVDNKNFWIDGVTGKTILDDRLNDLRPYFKKNGHSDGVEEARRLLSDTTISVVAKSNLNKDKLALLKLQLRAMSSKLKLVELSKEGGKVNVVEGFKDFEEFKKAFGQSDDDKKINNLFFLVKKNGQGRGKIRAYIEVKALKNLSVISGSEIMREPPSSLKGCLEWTDEDISTTDTNLRVMIKNRNEHKGDLELKDNKLLVKNDCDGFGSLNEALLFCDASSSFTTSNYEYSGSWLLGDALKNFIYHGGSKMNNEIQDVRDDIRTNTPIERSDKNLDFNTIYFGAPGTGKSYHIKYNIQPLFTQGEDEENISRVTFYPSLTYGSFVGCLKPTATEGDEISYSYVAGPLMRMVSAALKDESRDYLLIIEEINRANAAACFGDTFQLLDRDGDGNSEYPINTSKEQEKWLNSEGIDNTETLIFPSNLYIVATMNASDEGVTPLDTAFKRRFDFQYMDIDEGEEKIEDLMICGINWNKIRKEINNVLAEIGINEDKMLGAFFLGIEPKGLKERFVNKVLMYLFEDIGRIYRSEIFKDDIKTFSILKRKFYKDKKFQKSGFKVFQSSTLSNLANEKGGQEVESKSEENDSTAAADTFETAKIAEAQNE